MRHVAVDGAELGVEVEGSGEPVLLIQTGLVADEFLPLAAEPALLDHYRVIRYHRRGYGQSSPVQGAGSIQRDAADARALLAVLGVARAHVVGVSYSGAVALQMAADSPSWVHSLTLLEPPPLHVPSAGQFLAANAELVEDYHAYGPAALDRFLTRVSGPDWQAVIERALPGAAAQMKQDAGTFFDTDIPALLAWAFGADDARRITQAVLHIGGSESASGSLRSASSCSPGCHKPRTWCWPGPTTPWPSPTPPRSRQPSLPSCGVTRSRARPGQPTRPSANHEPTRVGLSACC